MNNQGLKGNEKDDYCIPSRKRKYKIKLENGKIVYVDYETFKRIMKSKWNDWKFKDRSSRCQISNGHGGLKRCIQDCKKCNHFRNGELISLDELYEKYNLHIADSSQSIIDKLNKKEINDALWEAISTLKPVDQKILKLFSEGISERDISRILNIPRTTISYRKNKCFEKLKELLKDYYY